MTAKLSMASILLLSVISCSFLNKEETSNQDTTEQTTNNETYVVQPKYDLPLFKKLDAEFAKQEHRFEIDRCEFKYNDKSFFIGDSMEKIISIFGEPDEKPIISFNKKVTSFQNKFLKILVWFSISENKLISFSINLNKDTPYNIIKFRKVPYQLGMRLNHFTELCDLHHDDNLGHNLFAFYIKNEKNCNSNTIDTEIGSTPSFNNIGRGHMTIRGEFDPKVTGPIKSLSISLSDLDNYKK